MLVFNQLIFGRKLEKVPVYDNIFMVDFEKNKMKKWCYYYTKRLDVTYFDTIYGLV